MKYCKMSDGTIYGAVDGDCLPGDEEIEKPQPKPIYKWQGLKDALRDSQLFSKAISTTNPNAFALLISIFDSASPDEAKLADFQFAIAAVRAGLAEDYTETQLSDFRQLLVDYGFPVFL